MIPYTVETASGLVVDLVTPTPETINIRDIAWSLSRLARYNGHTLGDFPYSVAQHSCWVANRVMSKTNDKSFALYALLHDAHEAYTGDMVSPMKWLDRLSHIIKDIEFSLQQAIHTAVDMPPTRKAVRDAIKQADKEALAVEAYHLMPSRGRDWNLPVVSDDLLNAFESPLAPIDAYGLFLRTWEQLNTPQLQEVG